ncbi:hypothetical protein AB0L85_26495 [Streptomyces sp. NPDC052051]|uniref:hypothetical protein n=1 Tax=Streptomyces sp. NPDC052051 TaxID=3154649 RepID=UPI0034423F35
MRAWHMRMWRWLRALILAAAVVGLIGCSRWVAEAYDGAMTFRHASVCRNGPAADCVARATGTVTGKEAGQNCTTDSDGVRSCTPYYRLHLRYGERTAWRGVGKDTYDEARRGDPAELRIWHGAVVRMTVRGHTATYEAPADDSVRRRLSVLWLLLGVAVWVAVSGRPAGLVTLPTFGWLWLTVPFSELIHGALLGASPSKWVMEGLMALVGVVCLFLRPNAR